MGFLGGALVKNLPVNAGDTRDKSWISRLGRYPGVGDDNRLQCSFLENFMGREAWQAAVHGVTKSQTRLSRHTHAFSLGLFCFAPAPFS